MTDAFEFFASKEDFSDVALVTTHRLWGPGGTIKVKINDYGEAAGDGRYTAYAQYADSQGRPEFVVNSYGASLGTPAATVDGALANINWDVFQESDQS